VNRTDIRGQLLSHSETFTSRPGGKSQGKILEQPPSY
jgi:hypothetical protein